MNAALIQTVQNLPLEEQFELLDLLFEQLTEPMNDLPLPEAEVLELQKRFARMQDNPKAAKPWREFMQENK